MSNPRQIAISLFSSGGIGDLALREAGFEIIVSNELLEERHALFATNFPGTRQITGDIWEAREPIEAATREILAGRPLSLFYATPPCQGMSKNGRGKLLNAIRAGTKPPMDERNRLIIPTMAIARALRPEIVLLENVPEMANTVIVDDRGIAQAIPDFVQAQLGDEYVGQAEVVEFADYGVPQRRQRLISIYARHPLLIQWYKRQGTLIAPPTHDQHAMYGRHPWVTVRNTIADLPALDAKCKSSATSDHPYHRVPLLDPTKHWWVRNTPPTRSAFDNQCIECGFQGNPTHTAKRDKNGINRTTGSTQLYCTQCNALLPRPAVNRGGELRLMKGFTSAYKRMAFDQPASALTRNLSYACSDNKLHPEQNRVLSLYEAFRLHTIDRFDYRWSRHDGRKVSDKTIREIIGESIPPAGLQVLVDHLYAIKQGEYAREYSVGPLFAKAQMT